MDQGKAVTVQCHVTCDWESCVLHVCYSNMPNRIQLSLNLALSEGMLQSYRMLQRN